MKTFKFLPLYIIALATFVIPSMMIGAQTTTPTATVQTLITQCQIMDTLIVDSDMVTSETTAEATASVDTTPVATVSQSSTATVVVRLTQESSENNSGELGDEASATYQDTELRFRIDYPHSWSQETPFHNGVCFTARDGSIAVQIVKGTPPTDLMAYVQADEANLSAVSSGYKQVYLKASTEIPGAIILGYEWDAGKSIVTEKPVHARTDRYYLVDSIGRLVIVTETEPINQFDPEGVRDTTLTYQVVN
jgi:hypothetical protein